MVWDKISSQNIISAKHATFSKTNMQRCSQHTRPMTVRGTVMLAGPR